ncbi:hypothetical protein ACFE04_021195 [Oxalis oulophora]
MKILFEKLFTEQDEITVLKGIHDYITKYGGKDPLNDIDEFFHLINDSLQCEANPTKMKDKIKRMNEKYLKNSIKNRNNGTEPIFKKPYDQRSKLSPPAESSSDDELMPLPKPTTLFEPYDDDTTNSHSEEESDEEDDISSGKAVKTLFKRLFTEQNEITVLDKINDYITKNGDKDHFNDIDGLFLLINDSLQCEANSIKLKDKIKRMKEKYLKNFIKRERMRLSLVLKNYLIKAPYDDDTSDSDLEEEFDDPKPQKPCSYSVAEESSDETSERSHSLASSTTKHVVVVQKLETPTTVVGSKKLKEVVVSKGIHDYIIKNGGKDPLNDIDKFFQVINDSLQQEESDDSKLQKSCSYSEEEEYGDETSDTNSENSIHPPSN